MATEVSLILTLVPVGQPWVKVSANGCDSSQQLSKPTEFKFEYKSLRPNEQLTVTHFAKNADDPVTAVIVKDLSFFGISDPKFIWQGQYCPNYPEPWYDQQDPRPDHTLHNTDYLGWNGVWSLEFTIPVFTWMHQVQNLGWIHP